MDLTEEQLAEELHARSLDRGRNDTAELSQVLARFIFKYGANLNFDSFKDSRGVTLKDHGSREIGLYPVSLLDGTIRCDRSIYTDILVLCDSTMILGWTTRDDVSQLDPEIFLLNSKSLQPMPTDFDFSQACPHMSVFGGFWISETDVWECFGCGQHLRKAGRS